jgi:hypothetical protein
MHIYLERNLEYDDAVSRQAWQELWPQAMRLLDLAAHHPGFVDICHHWGPQDMASLVCACIQSSRGHDGGSLSESIPSWLHTLQGVSGSVMVASSFVDLQLVGCVAASGRDSDKDGERIQQSNCAALNLVLSLISALE